MTWMRIGICVEIAWVINCLTFLKKITLKDLIEQDFKEWLFLLGIMAVDVLCWPLVVILQIKEIITIEKEKE